MAPQAPAQGPSGGGYLPWLDGMRAVGLLSIMVVHEQVTQPKFSVLKRIDTGGYLGVDIFFAISGFLITSILLREVKNKGRVNFGHFYMGRVRRLLPALGALLLFLSIDALAFQHGHARVLSFEHILEAATYTTNWVVALSNRTVSELNHTWSLAAEEQFYFLWPALLTGLLILQRKYRHALVIGVAVIAAATVLWPLVGTWRGYSNDRIYYGLDARGAGLGLGVLLGTLSSRGLLPTGRTWTVIRHVGAVVAAAVLLLLLHNPPYTDHVARAFSIPIAYLNTSRYAITGLATCWLIWELLVSPAHIGHRLLSWGPLVALGRISYAVYLWNPIVVLKVHPSGMSGWPLVGLHYVLTFSAGIASWFLVERWTRKKGKPTVPLEDSAQSPRVIAQAVDS